MHMLFSSGKTSIFSTKLFAFFKMRRVPLVGLNLNRLFKIITSIIFQMSKFILGVDSFFKNSRKGENHRSTLLEMV